ncbi:MAG: Anaphase-promoting complex subunit 23 [Alectoria fallacina]|uniref:Anaphase-promoting complex subunit 23 n=1 Tax=Alectoria fallacina TaxID=1903189 RepID=A0A8H3EUB6_9LECA|nr:MAG: Anaphase-promoting complex subunit 23 [Alectoria fallacina]
MADFGRSNTEQLRRTLQEAVVKCSERCLYQSAKWAAELSNSLPEPLSTSTSFNSDPDSQMQDVDLPPSMPSMLSSNPDPEEARLEAQELPKYLLAKSYFDCREYDRCAAIFIPSILPRGPLTPTSPNAKTRTPTKAEKGKAKESSSNIEIEPIAVSNTLPLLSQKSLFLALYAKYISGEKRKDEDIEMILGPADGGGTVNKELVGLARSLEGWFADRAAKGLESSNQGWLEYLYGIVLVKGKTEEDAKTWLIKSVHLCPFNWGAWLELSGLLNRFEDLQKVVRKLPQNLMTLIFHLYASQELYQSSEVTHHQLNDLERIFPESQFLKTQRALLYYHSKDFDEAESIFSALLHADPHRIDALDHYSNILYVMSARPKLAFLAQVATATDKFRPETCCVVGNYYSLKSEHEKAVVYFRRALTLDRSFLTAWTLMGHEYVEMKNTHAAIESYRRAVDANGKDYRAWYGLGQTYEVLEMHLYALFYFQRAASLRPYDPKMWVAVGNCYDKIDRPIQSIKAYKRALVAGTYYDQGSSFGSGATNGETPQGILDPETLYSIALVHEKMDQQDEAASYMEMTLAQEEGPGGDDDDEMRGQGTGVTNTTSKARMWLARWEFSRGGLARAMELANELCQDGWEVEEAKALIRDLRARLETRRSPS